MKTITERIDDLRKPLDPELLKLAEAIRDKFQELFRTGDMNKMLGAMNHDFAGNLNKFRWAHDLGTRYQNDSLAKTVYLGNVLEDKQGNINLEALYLKGEREDISAYSEPFVGKICVGKVVLSESLAVTESSEELQSLLLGQKSLGGIVKVVNMINKGETYLGKLISRNPDSTKQTRDELLSLEVPYETTAESGGKRIEIKLVRYNYSVGDTKKSVLVVEDKHGTNMNLVYEEAVALQKKEKFLEDCSQREAENYRNRPYGGGSDLGYGGPY